MASILSKTTTTNNKTKKQQQKQTKTNNNNYNNNNQSTNITGLLICQSEYIIFVTYIGLVKLVISFFLLFTYLFV